MPQTDRAKCLNGRTPAIPFTLQIVLQRDLILSQVNASSGIPQRLCVILRLVAANLREYELRDVRKARVRKYEVNLLWNISKQSGSTE